MKVTVEIADYSKPAQVPIRVHNDYWDGNKVEIEIDGEKRYTVDGNELISAIKRCMLDVFGR